MLKARPRMSVLYLNIVATPLGMLRNHGRPGITHMTMKPWAIGPFELLQHAEGHRLGQEDFDRRMALISFDNAIESSISTYLSLDPIQRGGRQYLREEVEKWKTSFHSKLAFLEHYASSAKIQMKPDRAEMVYYHRLRNELYHNGNGVVPAESHIRGIREAALWTFSLLFECDAEALLASGSAVGPAHAQFSAATTFLKTFLSARQALSDLAVLDLAMPPPLQALQDSLEHVAAKEHDPSLSEFANDLRRAEQVTQALVDDKLQDGSSKDLHELTQKLEGLSIKLDERLRAHQQEIVHAAFRATARAAAGDRRAGIILQAPGSGRTATLNAYITACLDEPRLPFRRYIVIFDRAIAVEQFVASYNRWDEIASPKARSAKGAELMTLLRDSENGPVATTIQQIRTQAAVYENECLVVYDGYTKPSVDLATHFPRGTFIKFTSTPHVEYPRVDEAFGGLVHAYNFSQAIKDRMLLPITFVLPQTEEVEFETYIDSPFSLPVHSEEWIERRAQEIIADHSQHPRSKAVVLCQDIKATEMMAMRMNIISHSEHSGSNKCDTALAVRSDIDAHVLGMAIQKFRNVGDAPAILVMTPQFLIGLDIPVAQTCYVTCNVSPSMRMSVGSLVSRPAPNKMGGRIVDYIGHSWSEIQE
jgi:hypothetical protein